MATIREVLTQDGQGNEGLVQKTTAVLHQQLAEAATLASYHDLFFLFAILAMCSLVPVLFLRSGTRSMARAPGAEDRQEQQPSPPPVRSPR
jgi:hypothetical protein